MFISLFSEQANPNMTIEETAKLVAELHREIADDKYLAKPLIEGVEHV